MDLSERYLTLLKKSLLDELYIENEARIVYLYLASLLGEPVDVRTVQDIARRAPHMVSFIAAARAEGRLSFNWDVPTPDGAMRKVDLRNIAEVYHTMIGRPRLDNIHLLLDRVVAEQVPGDLVEAGVWRGGATIFMRGYLAANGIPDRLVWAADSFAGLPVPSHPADLGYDYSADVVPVLSISRQEVEDLFARYDLLDERVRFLEGWFKDTLYDAPIERIALLRLDGDLYESTMDALTALYGRVAPGGFVIIDDYNDFAPCRAAVDTYRELHGVTDELHAIDWSAVWWQKS